jgi:hypothetical protein
MMLAGRHQLAVIVILAVLARGLIPIGFMPAGGESGMTLVVCPMGMPEHAHRVQHGGTHSAHDFCPYAQSSGAAPLLSLTSGAPGIAVLCTDVASHDPWVAQTRLPRHRAPRGPPASLES